MDKFKPKKKKDISIVAALTVVFAVLGILCIVVGCYADIVSWLKKFGLGLIIICLPLLIWLIKTVIQNKIKEM